MRTLSLDYTPVTILTEPSCDVIVPHMTTNLMSISDVVERSKLSEGGVYQLIREGSLKAVKIGRRTVVKSSDFEAWVDSLDGVGS